MIFRGAAPETPRAFEKAQAKLLYEKAACRLLFWFFIVLRIRKCFLLTAPFYRRSAFRGEVRFPRRVRSPARGSHIDERFAKALPAHLRRRRSIQNQSFLSSACFRDSDNAGRLSLAASALLPLRRLSSASQKCPCKQAFLLHGIIYVQKNLAEQGFFGFADAPFVRLHNFDSFAKIPPQRNCGGIFFSTV